MFFNDHAPPHFHARYGEFEATIDINTLQVIQGGLTFDNTPAEESAAKVVSMTAAQ
jgi:hypothetical protein